MSELISPVAKSILTSYRDSPFALQGDYKTYESRAGLTIAEIIDEVTEEWQKPYLRVILNDETLLADDYALTIPGEGDILNILVVPQGGDSGGIFKMVALIAITIVASYFLGPAGAGLTGPWLAGATAAVTLVSSLALNALFPPPSPSMASGSSGVATDPVYGFSTIQNASNPYGVIPRVYGRRMLMPQHAINPYVVSSGSDQYLYQIFTAGYGPLSIEQIMIGDTPIGNYKDVEYYIHESFSAGDELKICKNDIWQDPYSIALLHNVEHIVQTTNDAQSATIDIQFPEGLFSYNTSNGNTVFETKQVSVQIREAGTSTFHALSEFSPTLIGPSATIGTTVTSDGWNAAGSSYLTTPNYVVVDTLPDSSVKPVGSYITVATTIMPGWDGHTFHVRITTSYQDYQNNHWTTGSSDTVSVTGNNTKPFFLSINVIFPTTGKYDIRIVRIGADDSASNNHTKSFLSSVKSIKNIAPIAPDKPIAIIEMKIKATDQLSGSVQNLSCIVTSKLPVWNGSSWSVQATRNPAWAYLDVLRGSAINIPVPDYRINLSSFLTWANWCDESVASFAFTPLTTPDTSTTSGYVTSLYYTYLHREPDSGGLAYWVNAIDSTASTRSEVATAFVNSAEGQDDQRAKCDLEITSLTTVWDTLKLIAGTGYATPSTAGGKYSIAIDKVQASPVQLFTPRNIQAFSGLLAYHIQPHALRMQYTPTDSTTATEVVVFDDGYSANGVGGTTVATIYETMPLVGITRYSQAYVMGRRSIAQGRLRIETFTIKVDAENLLANRGDFVRLAHDVPKLGSGCGRVTKIVGNVITLDEDITNPGGSLIARVRLQDNTQVDLPISSVLGNTLTVSSASGVNIGDVVAYGVSEQITIDCLVKSIRPDVDFTAQIELVPYAPGIYTAETDSIPAYDPYGGTWSGGTNGGGNNSGNTTTPGIVTSLLGSYILTYNNGSPYVSVTLSWTKPSVGGTALSYKVYYLDYNPVVAGTTTTEYVTNLYLKLLERSPDSMGLAYWVGLIDAGTETRSSVYSAIQNSDEAILLAKANGSWRLLGSTVGLTYLAFDNYKFVDSSGNPIDLNGKALNFAVSAVGSDGSSYPPESASHVTVTTSTSAPSAITALTSNPGVLSCGLNWTYSNDGFDSSWVEIWGSKVNNRSTATLVAKVPSPTATYTHVGLLPNETWYYWVKAADGNGNFSAWFPESDSAGVSCTPTPANQYVDISGFTAFNQNAGGAFTPPNATLEAIALNITDIVYSWQVTGGTPTTASTQSIVVTPDSNATSIGVVLTVTGSNLSDPITKSISMPVVFNGVAGQAGSNGMMSVFPTIYQWTSSSTAPTRPTTTSAYTWSSGAFTPPTGWYSVSPSNTTTGNYLWSITYPLSAVATATTGTLNWTNTSNPIRCIAYNGTNGSTGATGSGGAATFVVTRYANDSSAPTNAEVSSAIGRYPVSGDICTVSYNNYNNAVVYRFTTSWALFNTYITGSLIVQNSITAATACIANAAINTLQVAGNAITAASVFNGSGDTSCSPSSWTTVLSGTITTSGTQPILVMFSGFIGGGYSSSLLNSNSANVNGVINIGSYSHIVIPSFTSLGSILTCASSAVLFTGIPAGTYTVSLALTCNADTGVHGIFTRNPKLIVLETKR